MTEQQYLSITGIAGQRLDICLSNACPNLSRSRLQALIKDKAVTVDGKTAKASQILMGGEHIVCQLPALQESRLNPEQIELNIAYEDGDIIVVDKPQGMVVHPAAGVFSGTLVNALLNHCGDLSGLGGVARPGIVHRIDKDTSGLLVIAKHDAAHQGLTAQWQNHDITRLYQAVLHGVMAENTGVIDAPIGRHPRDRIKMAVQTSRGRNAVTHYRVLRRFAAHTHVELRLETGRTHQIRVHMAHLHHAVAGDKLYGPRKSEPGLNGQALHAKVLGFKHPISGNYLEFDSPLPQYFSDLLHRLENQL